MCCGEDNTAVIEGNRIESNQFGPGVKIGIANKSSIIRNEIKLNKIGIEVVSGDPFIFNNKIDKNHAIGILTRCMSDFR